MCDKKEMRIIFHKIKDISILSEYRLKVYFSEGIIKIYDIKPLFDKYPAFQALKNPKLFSEVFVDIGGNGVVWNDDLDLSCDELWENGKESIS